MRGWKLHLKLNLPYTNFNAKVTRFDCHSDASDAELVIDINTEIYPMGHDKRFTLVLASTLSLSNAPSTGVYDQSRAPSLLDDYQYAMHGKVFKITEAGGRLYGSFSLFGIPISVFTLQPTRTNSPTLWIPLKYYLCQLRRIAYDFEGQPTWHWHNRRRSNGLPLDALCRLNICE